MSRLPGIPTGPLAGVTFMRTISRSEGCLVAAACVALALSLATPRADAGWSTTVNGFGFGNVRVDVWCFPAAPPGPPTYTAVAAGFGASASLGPGLPGCDPATQVTASIGPLWQSQHAGIAANGDTIDAPDLLPYVVPTSALASIDLVTFGSIVDSDTAMFVIDWSGSDAGTAQRLRFYADESLSTLLHEELRYGAWDETITLVVDNPVGLAEAIVMLADGLAVSVPEPASLLLVGLGFLAAGVWSRYRPPHR